MRGNTNTNNLHHTNNNNSRRTMMGGGGGGGGESTSLFQKLSYSAALAGSNSSGDPLAYHHHTQATSTMAGSHGHGHHGHHGHGNNHKFRFSTIQTIGLVALFSLLSAFMTNYNASYNDSVGRSGSSLLEFQHSASAGGSGVRRTSLGGSEGGVPVAASSYTTSTKKKKKKIREIERLQEDENERPPSDEIDKELFSLQEYAAAKKKKKKHKMRNKDSVHFDVQEQAEHQHNQKYGRGDNGGDDDGYLSKVLGGEEEDGEDEEDSDDDEDEDAENDDDVYKATPKSNKEDIKAETITKEKGIDKIINDEEEEKEKELAAVGVGDNDDYAVFRDAFKDEKKVDQDNDQADEDDEDTSDDEFDDDEGNDDDTTDTSNGYIVEDVEPDIAEYFVDENSDNNKKKNQYKDHHHQGEEEDGEYEPDVEYNDDDNNDDEFEGLHRNYDGSHNNDWPNHGPWGDTDENAWPEVLDSTIEELDSNIKITRNDNTNPDIAWLMSFPNSGTSFTIHMAREASNCTTATNYALEGDVPDMPSLQAIVGPRGRQGPYLELIRDRHTNIPSTILTKTHCIGYCSHCGPRKLLFETPRTFMRGCLTGTRGVQVTANATSDDEEDNDKDDNKSPSKSSSTTTTQLEAADVMYSPKLVKKAIHIFRHPLDNIVARFHLEYNEMSAANNIEFVKEFPKNATGFKRWCDRSDEKRDLFETKYIDQDLKDALEEIPCYNEFFKYVQWHNMCFYVVHDMRLPTMILHYHEYADNFYAARQRVLQFLKLPLVTEEKYEFHQGKEYRHYYSRQQKIAIQHFIKQYATRDTWNQLKRYDFEIDFEVDDGESNTMNEEEAE